MDDVDAHACLLGFAAGRVTPEDFEATLYAAESGLEHLLGQHETFDHLARELITPYRQLLDVNIPANAERARGIVRHYLEETDVRSPVDAELVAHVERLLGVKLPRSYLDFVSGPKVSDVQGYEVELGNAAPPELARHVGDRRDLGPLAKTFAEFLQRLHPGDDDDDTNHID